jgi:hypothetical protein
VSSVQDLVFVFRSSVSGFPGPAARRGEDSFTSSQARGDFFRECFPLAVQLFCETRPRIDPVLSAGQIFSLSFSSSPWMDSLTGSI